MNLKKKNKSKETKFLVSFKEINEINLNSNFVDIVDLKDPFSGTIGAWQTSEISKVVKVYTKKKLLSATLGDIKKTNQIFFKLKKFDELGLDFIKFGVFLEDLNEINSLFKIFKNLFFKSKIVPVFFAENKKSLNFLDKNLKFFCDININHFLIDTKSKSSLDLLDNCSIHFLEKLIKKSNNFNINVGLAGKLKKEQIPKLIKIRPQLIGLRSAICENFDRKKKICRKKLKKISTYFNSESKEAIQNAGV